MACSLSAASFAPSILFFVVALLIHAFGYSMVTPSLSGLVSRHAGNHHQGATMGVYQSAGSLARIAGPITAGLLYDHAGIASPFRVAAVLFICSSVIAMRRLKSSPRKASADRAQKGVRVESSYDEPPPRRATRSSGKRKYKRQKPVKEGLPGGRRATP